MTASLGALAVNAAAERLIEVVALARRSPAARLVFSGGEGTLFQRATFGASADERFVALMALEAERVLFKDRSRNTWENAVFTRALVAPNPDETWLLVTSAAHMPRSMGIFRQVGWSVTPWPVDFRTAIGDPLLGVEASQRLLELDEAVREWLGLLVYHLMGRKAALYPAP